MASRHLHVRLSRCGYMYIMTYFLSESTVPSSGNIFHSRSHSAAPLPPNSHCRRNGILFGRPTHHLCQTSNAHLPSGGLPWAEKGARDNIVPVSWLVFKSFNVAPGKPWKRPLPAHSDHVAMWSNGHIGISPFVHLCRISGPVHGFISC